MEWIILYLVGVAVVFSWGLRQSMADEPPEGAGIVSAFGWPFFVPFICLIQLTMAAGNFGTPDHMKERSRPKERPVKGWLEP